MKTMCSIIQHQKGSNPYVIYNNLQNEGGIILGQKETARQIWDYLRNNGWTPEAVPWGRYLLSFLSA